MRAVPSRISPATYPIAAAATARAYEFYEEQAPAAVPEISIAGENQPQAGQQPLFDKPVNEPRVISFDSLTTPAEREAIRARASEVHRPAPLKNERVELKRPRPAKSDWKVGEGSQQSLEFLGQREISAAPQLAIICNAPVAPANLRAQAGLIDGLLMALGCALVFALFTLWGGHMLLDKHTLPYLALALLTIPLAYKLLWTMSGQDSFGMQKVGLTVVDFDGNPPSQERRYQRFFGSLLSILAAGMGLLWSFVDEDRLTWHDHISNTFPTILE